jgi:MtaA/CmuA family methyltransferase
MTGQQRTLAFLRGQAVDRIPCHPIIMRWAARHAGVKYREFCLAPLRKCEAMIRCAEDFDLDWVTVMSDPYCEASAFGLQIEYPADNLPMDVGGHFTEAEAVGRLQPFDPLAHDRPRSRIAEIREFRRRVGDDKFIVGWVEGPVAAYANLRGVSEAALDFIDEPESVRQGMEVTVASALDFITLQVEAGADAIGIGDAFCSQIGPDRYRQLAWEGERQMVDHIHNLGAKAKLHICGDTTLLLPDMIRTGADIIDVDHLVTNMAACAPLLAPHQVFSGQADPVALIQDGSPEAITQNLQASRNQARGRCIVSAGCEITPDTTERNFRALTQASALP